MRLVIAAVGMVVVSLASAGAFAQAPTPPIDEPLVGNVGLAVSPRGASSRRASAPDSSLIEDQFPANAAYRALSAVKADRPGAVRGAKEVQLYRALSPSVVLVVAGDNSMGSGSLINSSGDILTNWHVVAGATEVAVVFKPQVEGQGPTRADARRARVIRVDEVSDLALLRVTDVPSNARPLELGQLSDVMVGADVHAIGHPTGEAWTYTKGVVSQIRRDYAWTTESKKKHQANVIQTQTPINPGNSGGPLLSDEGRLVGVNSFKSSGEGLNFAVSVEDVRNFLAANSGRVAASVPSKPQRSSSCSKEAVELYSGDRQDLGATVTGFDVDCDGQVDVELREPFDQSKAAQIVFDRNKDRKPDRILYDRDRDGEVEFSLHDNNYDGKWDLVGYHPDGKWVASRYERYEVFMARAGK
jgi:S1-C subfamily serine protease